MDLTTHKSNFFFFLKKPIKTKLKPQHENITELSKKKQKLNMHNIMHNTFITGKTTSKGPKYILQKPQQQW